MIDLVRVGLEVDSRVSLDRCGVFLALVEMADDARRNDHPGRRRLVVANVAGGVGRVLTGDDIRDLYVYFGIMVEIDD